MKNSGEIIEKAPYQKKRDTQRVTEAFTWKCLLDKISIVYQRKQNEVKSDESTLLILGITGSVAVGKTTFAKQLKQLLQYKWCNKKSEVISTDGFLQWQRQLTKKNLHQKKGFPETYDQQRITAFITDLKRKEDPLIFPVYDHRYYDVNQQDQSVPLPDILILEGLNVLQPITETGSGLFEIIDLGIYIDAEISLIRQWYQKRFLANRYPKHVINSFLSVKSLTKNQSIAFADYLWDNVNVQNLVENILPTKENAAIIIKKTANHKKETISFYKA